MQDQKPAMTDRSRTLMNSIANLKFAISAVQKQNEAVLWGNTSCGYVVKNFNGELLAEDDYYLRPHHLFTSILSMNLSILKD